MKGTKQVKKKAVTKRRRVENNDDDELPMVGGTNKETVNGGDVRGCLRGLGDNSCKRRGLYSSELSQLIG